jgi:hypothetical protein
MKRTAIDLYKKSSLNAGIEFAGAPLYMANMLKAVETKNRAAEISVIGDDGPPHIETEAASALISAVAVSLDAKSEDCARGEWPERIEEA